MADQAGKSIEELEAALTDVSGRMKAIKAEKRTIARTLEAKYAERAARERWERMSDPEKAAIRQVIGTEGIPSAGGVGTPGAGGT